MRRNPEQAFPKLINARPAIINGTVVNYIPVMIRGTPRRRDQVETDKDRCSLCGSPRIVLDRKRNVFGACTLIGCKDPIHDRRAEIAEKEPAASTPVVEKCGQPAASFIPRWGMSFACVLPKGHEGDHQRGGNCFKHGEYIGEKCPQWPNCIQGLQTAASTPVEAKCPRCGSNRRDSKGYEASAEFGRIACRASWHDTIDAGRVLRDLQEWQVDQGTPVEAPLKESVEKFGEPARPDSRQFNPADAGNGVSLPEQLPTEQPLAPRSQPNRGDLIVTSLALAAKLNVAEKAVDYLRTLVGINPNAQKIIADFDKLIESGDSPRSQPGKSHDTCLVCNKPTTKALCDECYNQGENADMAKLNNFYSINEINKPPAERVHHNDSACELGRGILPNERRDGTGGLRLCENCDKEEPSND
jgi:hypothetical protein